MKRIKRFIIFLLILVIGICVINAKTDLFLNFGTYVPVLGENYPEAAETVSYLSERLAMLTDYIPSFGEIIAMIKHEEPPIDPSDVASNAYTANSPMLTFYPAENIGVVMDYTDIQVFGTVASRDKHHLIVDFSDMNGETIDQTAVSANPAGEFNAVIYIPETDSQLLKVAVYTGSREYGQFTSWVYNYLTIAKTPDGGWELPESPIFAHNKQMYEKDKSIKEALKYTASIQSNSESIASIARQLTEGIDNDYDKALALHDWVCSYMYYDVDSLNSEEIPPYYATDVVKSGRAVCRGFATLMAALCRSIDIPCNVVTGYALGVGDDTEWTDETVVTEEQNHAWNEVYADGRWVIVDTTWDCTNKVENGEAEKGSEVSHIYFDANLQFFSANHKIIEYSKR